MKYVIGFAALGIFLAGISGPAPADTFVWKDPHHDFTMSFPDSWRMQSADQADDSLRIAESPDGSSLATCGMSVQKDGRLDIYPKRLMDEAVVGTLNKDYWQSEIGRFEKAEIIDYYSPASLGDKGDATAVRVSFYRHDGRMMAPMQGIMVGSIYGGNRYVAHCSARADSYERLAPVFAGIIDSIELEQKYHPFKVGYYRNFLLDPKLVLPPVKAGSAN